MEGMDEMNNKDTREYVMSQLQKAKEGGYTHVVILLDTSTNEPYAYMVKEREDPRVAAKDLRDRPMQVLKGVYCVDMSWVEQSHQECALNYGYGPDGIIPFDRLTIEANLKCLSYIAAATERGHVLMDHKGFIKYDVVITIPGYRKSLGTITVYDGEHIDDVIASAVFNRMPGNAS